MQIVVVVSFPAYIQLHQHKIGCTDTNHASQIAPEHHQQQ